MNTYKTKSQKAVALLLAFIMLMPTQALAAVSENLKDKKDINAEVRPEIIMDNNSDFSVSKPKFQIKTEPKKSDTKTEIIIPEKVEIEVPNAQEIKSNLIKADTFSTSTMVTQDEKSNYFNITIDSNIDPEDNMIHWYITVENLVDGHISKDDERTLDATFLVNRLSGLSNLRIEKLMDSDGRGVAHTKRTNKDNKIDLDIETMGIKTRVPNKITYYLTADIDSLNSDDIYSLDFSFNLKDSYNSSKRYAINGMGNLVDQNSKSNPIQTYKDSDKTITTDIVLAQTTEDEINDDNTKIVTEDKNKSPKFEYEITEESKANFKDSKVTIEYYNSTDEGYVKEASKELIYVDNLPEKIELDLKEGQVAKIVTESIKKDEIKPELVTPSEAPIIMEETYPRLDNEEQKPSINTELEPSTAPEIIVDETRPEISEESPIIFEENKPAIITEARRETAKRPEIKIEENIFETRKAEKLLAPKTKVVFDKLEGSKEDVKIELETRREELDKKIATLDKESEKAKSAIISSKPEIIIDEAKEVAPKLKLSDSLTSLKSSENIMADIESSEITENDLAAVATDLNITTEDKTAREALAEKLVTGELTEEALKVYLEDIIIRKELSTEEIQLVIDSIGNEYDLNKSELKEILRLVTEKLNNNNEAILEMLKENGLEIDSENPEEKLSQTEIVKLLEENGKSEKEAKEIASSLYEKTGYELNPEKVLRDALANKSLSREELENLIDEIVKEYGIDKSEVERILDKLNLEETSQENLAKDIIELNENKEEINLNLAKSRILNILKTFALTDEKELEILEKLSGTTKGEVLKSLDEILPTYGFGAEDIDRIKTNIFTEVESYELVESLRAILTPYQVTQEQVEEILNRVFLNPNLTPDELRNRIREILPEYNFGIEDVEKIIIELLGEEISKTASEELRELLASGEITKEKLIEFLTELKDKYNLTEAEIETLLEENKKDLENILDETDLLEDLIGLVGRIQITRFAYEVEYQDGKSTGLQEVELDEIEIEEETEIEKPSLLERILGSDETSKSSEKNNEEEIKTIKKEETQKSSIEVKSPEEIEVERVIRELLTTRPAEEVTFDELSRVLAEELPYIDLAQIDVMNIFFDIVNTKEEVTYEKSADEKLAEILDNPDLDNEIFNKELRELKDAYNLSDDELKSLLENHSDRINEIKGDFTIEEIIAASSYESENTVLAATDFGPKKFHLLTEMNVLASAGWQIPEGYYFDINIGPYLKQGTNNLKSLTDESGKVIAIPSYDEATNIIRYTFPSDLIVTKNLKIDQYLDFNVDKIPADADDVNINISVKPKNGVLQSLPTIKVNKNDQNPSTLIPGGKTPGISTDTSGDSYRKTYPYDIDYWTYQYYDQEKNTINWDIQIETHKVNLEHLNFYNLGLALYAPEAQGLENYKVTIRSYPKDMTVTKRSLVKKQTTPTTGIDFETAGTLTKNGDSNLLTYNKSFEKGGLNNKKLPEDLFIHIEAKPTDNHAKYQMYDLGLRLTPDVNYINDIVQEFKDDWAKLVAMMPWIIPYKDGEAFAEKFADGFNVVDTRLPADAMAAAYYDDKFKATSYTDKSRSVFGEFTSDNQIRWQISDTLRLQDKDRKVQGSNLGNEIFNKSFNANNSTGHTNPNIEVLEPKSDGTYTKIFSTTAPTNPSGAEDFRNKLSNVRPVLLPGTIINYTFKDRTATNPSEDSTVTINFSDRVDDEVGTYGGSQTATLRKLSPKEIEDNEKYRVVYAEYKSGDIKNEKNRIDAMIIKSTGDIVYCLNATLSSPAAKGIADNVRYSKKYEDISGAKLNELISRKTSSQEALIRRLKAIFYTAEYEYNFNSIYISANEWGPDKTKYNAVQAAIYRAIDDYNNGIGLNTAEEKSYYRGFANGDPNKVFEGGIKPTVDSFYNKVKEVEGRLGGDLDNLVRLDGYESIMDSSKKAQNVLGPVFTSPFEIDKVDKDDNKLSGIEFNIVDSNGAIVKKWTSSEKTEKIYLKPGVYTLKEVDSKTYKAIKDVKFEIKEEKVQVNKYDYIDFSNKQSGQVTNYKNQLKLALLENDNKDSSFGQLVTLDNDAIKIKVKNIGDTKLEVSKKLLGADGKYHELAGIKFTLEGNGIFNWTKKEATTNKDGIAVFDNLPLNSQWTLKEIVPKDIVVDHGVTWNVKVDRSGNVTVVPSQIDDSISSFKDGVLTVINEPDIKEPGNFKIKKVDSETKQPIKEVEFSLYGSDKKTQIGETTKTNENGEIYYRNLPNGIYYLKENIPQGYKAISEWTTIIVNNGQTSVVNVDITVGANGDMISLEPKYSLTIVNEIGNAIDINITDGTINANNLNNGTYTIKDGDKEVLTIEVKNKKIVNLTDPNKPLNNSEDDNSTDDNPVKEPTEDPKPIEPQYPKYIEVSNNENSVIVQFPDYTSKSVRIFQGKVDISSWNTGTYTIEDDGYGNRLVASVKDGQVVNLQKYRLQTPVPINGKTLYVKHDDYPSYMNFKEYSEVTNTNTGEITTYIMLKPDANNGGNGTDRNTIYNIYSSNSTIKKAELFRVGTGSTKSTVSNAMTNQNMRSYMNTTYVAKPDTQEYSQNNPISINEIKNNTVDLNTTSVRVTLPKERFANDWSFVLKITSNIDNKLEPAFFNYMWNSEASGEASITGDRDIPALQKYVKVSKLDNVIFANLLNTVKTSYNTLSEFITPTVYAAEEDVTKLDPSLVNNDNFYNTTKEKTVIEKINNGLELIQDTPISNVT